MGSSCSGAKEFLSEWNSSGIPYPTGVYEPAEDSFLLLNSLSPTAGKTVLDMGTGSGIIGIFSALHDAERVVSTDITPAALTAARRNAGIFGAGMELVRSDLFSALSPGIDFDIIAFNPPYLPPALPGQGGPGEISGASPADGRLRCALEGGGTDGSLVSRRFLAEFYGFLGAGGSAYLIVSSLNNPSLLRSLVNELHGGKIEWKTLSEDRFFFERIYCVELRRI